MKGISITNNSEDVPVFQISIDQAYKLAIRAKKKKDSQRANRIIAIISRAIKEDGNKGYYTGTVRFIGTEERKLIRDTLPNTVSHLGT